ncbi:MAG: GIY-YIG nuclease family protein [Acidobacteria bacterium]|nr:GIY-YIG nuclease family protein [Acidobacteriota bacterium]
MPHYVYILQSLADGRYYIGQTSDLQNRLQRHNAGRCSFTRSRGPWQLVHSETFTSRAEAMRRERQLKKHSRMNVLPGPGWPSCHLGDTIAQLPTDLVRMSTQA